MKKEKSYRNKTIDFSLDEGREYFERCLDTSADFTLDKITNKTINGDTFAVLDKLPKGFVDLLIVDPPYNLSKNYNGKSLRKPIAIVILNILKMAIVSCATTQGRG